MPSFQNPADPSWPAIIHVPTGSPVPSSFIIPAIYNAAYTKFPRSQSDRAFIGFCQNVPDPGRHRAQTIHRQHPGTRHHRTPAAILCPRLNGSEPSPIPGWVLHRSKLFRHISRTSSGSGVHVVYVCLWCKSSGIQCFPAEHCIVRWSVWFSYLPPISSGSLGSSYVFPNKKSGHFSCHPATCLRDLLPEPRSSFLFPCLACLVKFAFLWLPVWFNVSLLPYDSFIPYLFFLIVL